MALGEDLAQLFYLEVQAHIYACKVLTAETQIERTWSRSGRFAEDVG